MKNKGFTLIEMIAVVIILGLIILIAVPFFTGSLNVFRDDYYEDLKNNVNNAGKEFFADNKLYLPHSTLDASFIKVIDLINGKYINEVKDYTGKSCDASDSYVVVIRKGRDDYEYTTCMKCSEDDYDSTTNNSNCSSAWIDGFKMTGLRKADTAYVYVGSSKETIRKKVVAYPSIMRCLKEDINCTNPIASVSDTESNPIYPMSIDKVNPNKVGTYPVEYRYENGPIVNGSVVVYQNSAPIVSIEKNNNIHKDTIGAGTEASGFIAYDPDTATDWAYDMKLTFTNTFPTDSVETGTTVSRYQIYYHGRWEDYCKNISGTNNQCVQDEIREMNEIVKFRYIDNHGNVSKETREYNLRVDRTKPTCSLTLSGAIGADNWHVEETEVKFASKDDKNGTYPFDGARNPNSGIKRTVITTSELSNIDHIQHGDISSVKWYGFVEDYAYNFITCDITFKQDLTAPTCALKFEGTAGSNGWYKNGSDVTISFASTTEPNSGIQSYGFNTTNWTKTATRSESTGSSGVTYTGYVKNGAGLSNTCTKTLYYDKDIPECTPNKGNLNTTAGVTVTFACDNNTGGSTTSCPSTVTGLKSSNTYTATDAAGNSKSCPVTVYNKQQKQTKSCTAGKRCPQATQGCEQWNECTHQECGTDPCNCDDCYYGSNTCQGGYTSHSCTGTAANCTGQGCPKCSWFTTESGCEGNTGCNWTASGWDSCATGSDTCSYGCDQCPRTCRISLCGCEYYYQDTGKCGCETWGSYGSWSDDASCTPNGEHESSNHQTTKNCRTVYY